MTLAPAQMDLFTPAVADHAVPYAIGSVTSHAAAVAIAPHIPTLEAMVLAAIKEHAMCGGLTDLEGQRVTGIGGDTYRPRRGWLKDNGYIRDSGKTRKTASGRPAVVWEAV